MRFASSFAVKIVWPAVCDANDRSAVIVESGKMPCKFYLVIVLFLQHYTLNFINAAISLISVSIPDYFLLFSYQK